MKKLLLATVAALTLVGPLAPLSASADPQGYQGQRDQHQQDQRPGPSAQDNGFRHDNRHVWRDTRADARWDETQHNGYYSGKTWHYGAPPQNASRVSFGYHPWQRGQRLGYYKTRYQEVNYRDHHLRRPSRGYHWVQDDRGDYLLAAIATGIIASVILSNNR